MPCVSSCQVRRRGRSIRHNRDYHNPVLVWARLGDEDSDRGSDSSRVLPDCLDTNPLGPRSTARCKRCEADLCLCWEQKEDSDFTAYVPNKVRHGWLNLWQLADAVRIRQRSPL